MTVVHAGGMLEFPLAVAPSAATAAGTPALGTEADFVRFLKDRGTDKQPHFDLNGDGARNYVDDYIFAVNYLAAQALPDDAGAAPAHTAK